MRCFAFIPAVFIATAAVADDPSCIEGSASYKRHVENAGYYCPCVESASDMFLTAKGRTIRITCIDTGEGAAPGKVDFFVALTPRALTPRGPFTVSVADEITSPVCD